MDSRTVKIEFSLFYVILVPFFLTLEILYPDISNSMLLKLKNIFLIIVGGKKSRVDRSDILEEQCALCMVRCLHSEVHSIIVHILLRLK